MRGGPVVLHVGLMKTGTTFLQGTLRANADEVLRQGVSVVPARRPASFRMAIDLRGMISAETGREKGRGAFDRLGPQLDAAPGERCLISEEVLAGAKPEHIDRMGALLAGREVDVVVTLRDVARTLPSAWQEYLKGGHSVGFEEFLDAVRAGGRSYYARRFRGAYAASTILSRWSALAPPDRLHVVTVPQPGAPRALLLERFCAAVGLDATGLDEPPRRANESLGRSQAELLRRVNARLPQAALHKDSYGEAVKGPFTVSMLAGQDGDPIRVPAAYAAWCQEYADTTREAIRAAGYDVVGDLSDLDPAASAFADDPAPVAEGDVAAAATQALADLLADAVARHRAAASTDRSEVVAAEPSPPGRARRALARVRDLRSGATSDQGSE